VPPDQAPGISEMVFRKAIHLNVTRGDVQKEPGTLHSSGIPIQNTSAHLHCERGLNLE
jgi:hypothetical protein